MSEKLNRDEKTLNLIVRLVAVLIIGLVFYMGFFVKDSFIYADLHPLKIWDIIGLGLLVGFTAFITGILGQIWTMNSRSIGWAAWGAGVLGILLIIA